MAHVVVLGRSGTGKFYHTGILLEQTVPEFTFAVHYDIEDEEIGLSNRNHDPLYRTLRVDDKLARKLNWKRVITRHRKIRAVPIGLTEAEMRALYPCASVGNRGRGSAC